MTVTSRAHEAGAKLAAKKPSKSPGIGSLAPAVSAVWRSCSNAARTARGTAVEVGWIATHVATYPLGLRREHHEPHVAAEPHHPYRTDRLRLSQRGLLVGNIEAARTPILLVHGVIDNHSVFGPLRHALHRRGFGRTLTFSYELLPHDLRRPAAQLRDVIEQLCSEVGYDRIHVVGHSLGGLLARYTIQRLGAHQRVHTLVTLGTPHHGTSAARAIPHPLLRQLRPGSDLFAELDEAASDCSTRFVSVWSDLDEVIHPQRNAQLEHPDLSVRNVSVRGVGHLSLPIDTGVVDEISTTLTHLDTHGSTTEHTGGQSLPGQREQRTEVIEPAQQ